MTDPIQHLRELLDEEAELRYKRGLIAEFQHEDCQCRLRMAAVKALPALLAVAEAARAYMAHKFPNGDQLYMVTHSMQMHKLTDDLLDAIAKLDEVKP